MVKRIVEAEMSYQAKIREEAAKLNPIDDIMFRKMEEGRIAMSDTLLKIIQEERDEGEKRGKKEGKKVGEKIMASLVQKLISANRISEIETVANDETYREKLYAEFGIA